MSIPSCCCLYVCKWHGNHCIRLKGPLKDFQRKSYTEIGQLILRIDATAPGRLCLGDDEYLLARNALNDLRNQRIASGGYTDAADAALANLLRAKVPFHLFGHMR